MNIETEELVGTANNLVVDIYDFRVKQPTEKNPHTKHNLYSSFDDYYDNADT